MIKFEQAWRIYEEAFPVNERRSLSSQRRIQTNPNYYFLPLLHDQTVVGLLATWEFDDFIFIEHYAIDQECRGKGYGTSFLKQFLMTSNSKRIVLEVEPPESCIAVRRIQFYEAIHFHSNPYSYVQPAYDEDKQPLALRIMTYPDPISEDVFAQIKAKLYEEVYGQTTI